MKKVLLGTTALLGASLLALPATAQAISPDGDFDIELKGEVQWEAHYDSNPAANKRGHWVKTTGYMQLSGDAVLTDGAEVDFEIEFEFEDDDGASSQEAAEQITIDDMWAHIDASWGQIWVGELQQKQNDDATTQRKYLGGAADGGLSIGEGQAPGNNDAQVLGGSTGGSVEGNQNLNDVDSWIEYADDVDIFVYEAPEMGGMTLTVNYQPEINGNGENNGKSDTNDAGEVNNAVILQVEWEGTMGETPVEAVVNYGRAAAEGTAALVDDDVRIYAGVLLNDGGAWEVGAFYAAYDGTARDAVASRDVTGFGIGGVWENGAWEYGASWETTTTDEAAGASGSDDYVTYDAGAEYTIDDDRSVTIGYRAHSWTDGANLATDEGDAYQYGIQYEWDINSDLELFAGVTSFDYVAAADGTETGANLTLTWDMGAGVEWETVWDYQSDDGQTVKSVIEVSF